VIGAGSFDALGVEEAYPGVLRQSFSSEEATVSRYTFSPGARFPVHRHPQEQITLVHSGSIEMTVAGEQSTMGGGEFAVVGKAVEHGITAGPDGARILAIIVPARQDESEIQVSEAER
jgi:quercetin dioxygenase-like cupin family protein